MMSNQAKLRRSKGRAEPSVGETVEPSALLGRNVRRLRAVRGLSLDRLAVASGVSRTALTQIEQGSGAPTITVIWKIAGALDVPFAELLAVHRSGAQLLRGEAARRLRSASGAFTSRALFPFQGERKVEFYELRVAPGGREDAEPHGPGTVENLVVASGAIEIVLGSEVHALAAGDAILFEADQPHGYVNRGRREAVLYLVMTYDEG